ncbi:MAG: lycopene cyclase domain-containing protein [Candidatus Nanohaloarchaea archaeon]
MAVTLFFFSVGVAWDSFAVLRGHWSFGSTGLTGIRIGVLPLEEYIFMVVVPFWIITVYRLFDLWMD